MERIKEYRLPIIIVAVFLIVFLGRYLISINSTDKAISEENNIEISLDELLEPDSFMEGETNESEIEFFPLLVDIKGAVVSPGVYELTKGDRVDDVIRKAGGLTEEANTDAVNFAQHVKDEMVVYVPVLGEEGAASLIASPTGADQQADELININNADLSTLLQLNGIGPQKAQSIIDYREANGFFKTIDELTDVSGIGLKTVEKIQNQITVN